MCSGFNSLLWPLQTAAQKEILSRMSSKIMTPSEDEHQWFSPHACCRFAIALFCAALSLPIGIVQATHGWQKIVRCGAVMVCTAAWATCVYTAVSGGNMG